MLSSISQSTNLNSFILNVKNHFTVNNEKVKDYTDKVGKLGEEFCLLYFGFNNRLFDIDNCYLRNQIPVDIKEKLKLDDKDRGTDILLEHTNGKFSFVQSKFRTNIKESLTRDSVSNMTLESFGSFQPKIKYIQNLYLFSTVINHPKELSKSERSKIKFVLYNELSDMNWDLFKTFVINIKTNKENIFSLQKVPELYEHQKKALDVSKNQKLLTQILPCGAGKTLISYLEVEREIKETGKNTLILVPSLYLVSQTFRESSLYSDLPKLLIGSDYNDEDDENYNFPFQLTTDEKEIFNFLKENQPCIIISTYQSSIKIYNVCKKNNIQLGLTICDEAHLTSSTNTNGCFTVVLKKDFPTIRKIFMTATMKIYKGKNDECYSMDDEKVYGKINNILSFRQAIEKNILSDYKIMIGVDKENNFINKSLKGLKNEEEIEYDITTRDYIMLNMIKKDMEEDYSRILICSNNHKHSSEFYNFCKEQLKDKDIEMMLMKANSTGYHKDKAVNLLRNNKKCIIFQVKIFNLGVNINEITTIGLLDDKSSTIDIVQTISRALRRDINKEEARILIPTVITDDEKNCFDMKEFKNMRNVLTSLAIYDDAIKEEILMKMKKENKEIKTEKEYKQRIFIVSENIDIKEMTEISLQMYDKLGERSYFTWDNKLRIILEYKEENENKNPKAKDKINCGGWFQFNCVNYRRGTLLNERKLKFDEYNLIDKKEWNTKKVRDLEKVWYNNLYNILENSKELDDQKWLKRQILYYRQGKMSNERKNIFDEHNLIEKEKWNTFVEEKGKNSQEKLEKKLD